MGSWPSGDRRQECKDHPKEQTEAGPYDPESIRLSVQISPMMNNISPAAMPNVSEKKVGEMDARITPIGAPIIENMLGHIVVPNILALLASPAISSPVIDPLSANVSMVMSRTIKSERPGDMTRAAPMGNASGTLWIAIPIDITVAFLVLLS